MDQESVPSVKVNGESAGEESSIPVMIDGVVNENEKL
jgi:hypothetical protein